MGVLGGGWSMESGGRQARGGWINESVVSVGGWVCVCVGVLSVGLGPGLDSMSPARSRRRVHPVHLPPSLPVSIRRHLVHLPDLLSPPSS